MPLSDVSDDSLVAGLESLVPRLMESARIQGLSIAIIRDGRLIWNQGFGAKNVLTGDPVDEHTVFEAASLTKPLFGYFVMKQVELGLLDLDTPLVELVPQDLLEKTFLGHRMDMSGFQREWCEKVTARLALSHSSGLPHGQYERPHAFLFEPGTKFRYSSNGYEFLRIVIEHLRGRPLEQLMSQEAIGPLGMDDSCMVWDDRYEAQAAVGHDVFGETDGRFRKRRVAVASASLYTTTRDYARFVSAIINDQGLKPETFREMLTPQIPMGEEGLSWAIGIGLEDTVFGKAVWQWGDLGIFRNYVIAYKPHRCGVIYLTNSFNGLSIGDDILDKALGLRECLALRWLKHPRHDSATSQLYKKLHDNGIQQAISFYEMSRTQYPAEFDESNTDRLARQLLSLRRRSDAIQILKLNRDSYPDSASANLSLGEAYIADGDPVLAAEHLRNAARLDPANERAASTLVFLGLLSVLWSQGAQEASELLSETRNAHPERVTEKALGSFCATLQNLGRREESLALLKVNVKAHPGSGMALYRLAQAHLLQDEARTARDYAEEALQLDPYLREARILIRELRNQ